MLNSPSRDVTRALLHTQSWPKAPSAEKPASLTPNSRPEGKKR